ncbi:hypothetical protein PRIPAC_90683 [Pristionchus pacificus]|uniref:Uncharacterized protein n=1 Tax=Pristionchus pacificus TaxID=54126 RepID=A0A2A6B3Z0_PRIPA|nr:hypothetical protein PRIPAC_90683 [Pristionchus pacificus]|eukprot:PDM60596.1 hypothetical protein PRIPAC_53574 [Pristionchus pacificus]
MGCGRRPSSSLPPLPLLPFDEGRWLWRYGLVGRAVSLLSTLWDAGDVRLLSALSALSLFFDEGAWLWSPHEKLNNRFPSTLRNAGDVSFSLPSFNEGVWLRSSPTAGVSVFSRRYGMCRRPLPPVLPPSLLPLMNASSLWKGFAHV